MKLKSWASRFFNRKPEPSEPNQKRITVVSRSIDTRGKSRAEIERSIADVVKEIVEAGPPRDILAGEPEPPEIISDDITWARWVACRESMLQDGDLATKGWAACRFACRLPATGMTFFPFGMVKEHFGVFTRPFLLGPVDGSPVERLFTCVTHLASGANLAVFEDQALAIDAAEAALHMPGIAWEKIDITMPTAELSAVTAKVEAALMFIGVERAEFCIHDFNGPPELGDIGPCIYPFLRKPHQPMPKEKLS